MIEQAWTLSWVFIITAVAFAQSTPPHEKCKFDQKRAQQVRRIAAGIPAIYYFACQENNPNADATGCIKESLKPGLVVSLNRTKGAWACVSGDDSTSGWVERSHLQSLRSEPGFPLKTWEGWWERPAAEQTKGLRSDRLLITEGQEKGSFRVSGRAYWYGIGNLVHYGQIVGRAMPVGRYLHVVDGSCVVDLAIVSSKRAEIQAKQNEFEAGACGGMNVTFSGKWVKFIPSIKSAHRGAAGHGS